MQRVKFANLLLCGRRLYYVFKSDGLLLVAMKNGGMTCVKNIAWSNPEETETRITPCQCRLVLNLAGIAAASV